MPAWTSWTLCNSNCRASILAWAFATTWTLQSWVLISFALCRLVWDRQWMSKPTCVARSLDRERSQVASLIGLVLEVTCTFNESFHFTHVVDVSGYERLKQQSGSSICASRASLFPIQSGPQSLQRANNAKLTCSPIITSTPSRLSYSIVFTRFITYSHTKPSGISWSQMIQMIKVTHWIPMIADHPYLNKNWGRGWSLAFLASSRTWTSCRNLALSAKASVFHPSTQHAWTCQIYTNTPKWSDMPLPY